MSCIITLSYLRKSCDEVRLLKLTTSMRKLFAQGKRGKVCWVKFTVWAGYEQSLCNQEHAQYIQGICPLPFISLYTWSNVLNTFRKLNEDDYWRCLDRILKHKSPRRLPQSNLGQKLENWREFWASAECRWNASHLWEYISSVGRTKTLICWQIQLKWMDGCALFPLCSHHVIWCYPLPTISCMDRRHISGSCRQPLVMRISPACQYQPSTKN